MRSAIAMSVMLVFSVASITAQTNQPIVAERTRTTVRIPLTVSVDGRSLPAGTYELVVTDERPTPLPGQSADAQRWIEFVTDGRVIARVIAEVIRDDDLTPVGTSSQPVSPGTRVEMLKGGEYLRVSTKHAGERFLVHLPVAPQ